MKIICVGRNYVKHIEELQNVVLKEPAIFLKPETALLKAGDDFVIPAFSSNVHHEIEIVLKIGREGKNIPVSEAGDYFDEMALGIDFTARDVQDKLKEKKLSWELAKAFDGAAACGRFVNKKDVRTAEQIHFQLYKNQDIVQDGRTTEMIFKFDYIISFVSKYFLLEKGDLIYTGTPAGVGPVKSGDVLKGYLEGNKNLEVKVR
jgi:acylpyruvate hydrolase